MVWIPLLPKLFDANAGTRPVQVERGRDVDDWPRGVPRQCRLLRDGAS
jgi:hypothetical protein